MLELSFLCNLIVLCLTLNYLKGINANDRLPCAATNISISVSFITFVGILAYHAYLRVRLTRWADFVKQKVQNMLPHPQNRTTPGGTTADQQRTQVIKAVPSTTLIELHEGLLSNN